jgi:hypothetical protein
MSDEEENFEEILIPLLGMLEMVAFKRGLRGMGADMWVQVIYANLGDIGIHTLREFMSSVLTVNEKLDDSGHKRLEAHTLNLMVVEVCDMMFGPEEEHVNVGEPAQDLHRE